MPTAQTSLGSTEASAVPIALSSGAVRRASRNRWIQSAWFDCGFFLLSPLAGLVLVAGHLWLAPRASALLALAGFYFIGMPHYLSTLTFYLGDDTLRQFRLRPMAFFLGPLVVLVAVPALWWGLEWHPLITAVLYTWNIYHVSRQSAGILNIYRQLNGGPRSERTLALLAILSTTATLALWPVHGHPALVMLLGKIHPLLLPVLDRLCLAVAAGSCVGLLWRLSRRATPISLPELGFLLTSLSLGLPYLLLDDLRIATLAMLMGHFVQYLALVWLLNRRKYGAAHGSARERLLGLVSRHPLMLGAFWLVVGSAFWGAERMTRSGGAHDVYWCVLICANFVHFYLDGLIWAFRRPEVRQSLGPYLFDRPGVA
jgi:hypothetical protein